uniref:MARVEL domain-containing protein n=1 Tax=Elaeophora elaphi TaxID=1147741 RepID=A0A158Q8L4_9BILA
MPPTRGAVQSREIAMDSEKLEKEKKSFVYNKDDEFYSAPAFCYLLHYRNAAVFCGILEVLLLIVAVLVFLNLQLEKANIRIWFVITLVIFLVFATITTLLMIYGIVTEKPKYMWPLMAFMHIEVTILITSAIASITSMSMGLQATHRLFGLYVSIHKLEKHFGPIWPFNLAILSFFAATIVIWSYIMVRGAYDYLLDKEYFTRKSSIEMVKTIVVNGV